MPLFVCDTCGLKDDTWQKFYTDYLMLHKQKSNWAIEKHKVSCIIGYFCYMYEKNFSIPFKFVPSSPNPFSSVECKYSRMLLATFDNDALKVRTYITWIFEKELNGSKTLTSFGYLKTPNIVRKFMLFQQQQNTKTRSSSLPLEFLEWCKQNTPTIFDKYSLSNYNDIISLNNYINAYNLDNQSLEFKVIKEAETFGIIKDGKIIS